MEEDILTMAQEDQIQTRSSSNGDGGRSCKKQKQKKVPQRGLGVAQLEKIRREEEQQRDASSPTTILPSPPCSVSSAKSPSSFLSLPMNNFHHSNQQPSSPNPLNSGPPSDFRSTTFSLPNLNGKFPSNVPFGSSFGVDFEKESFGLESGLPFLPNLPTFESNPIWPLPNWVQRTPQFHPPQPSSSMVNVSSGTSLTTHVPHFPIEPPSNQNYSGSSVPMRPVEKIVGMKRPYPFSLDFPAPTFNYKLPIFPETRTDAKTSCVNGSSGFNFDAGNSTSREVPSPSASNSEPKKINKENGNLNRDFLRLAPPTPTSCSASKSMPYSTFLAFRNQEFTEYDSLSYQGNHIEDQTTSPPGHRLFDHQQKQPYYSIFLPVAKEEQIVVGQTRARIQNCHEVGESIDLNLKL